MDKLTRQQEDVICELLHHSHSEEVTQYILEQIGNENLSRRVLSSVHNKCLNESQIDYFHSLGGHFSVDEVSEHIYERRIERAIAKELKVQGATSYLYKNEDYLNAIRAGEIIIEGIDVEQIKKLVIEEE